VKTPAVVLTLTILLMSCASVQAPPLVANSGRAASALEHCQTDLRYLNQVLGWQGEWPSQWQAVVKAGSGQADQAIVRWSEASLALTSATDKLRMGISRHDTAPRIVALRVHQQVQDLVNELSTSSSTYTFNNLEHKNASNWNSLIKNEITQAVSAFEVFLHDEYLPATHEAPGLASVKGGAQCYSNAVEWWTGLKLAPDEIEKIGWRVLNDTRAEMAATGINGETLNDTLQRLRTSYKDNETSAEELIEVSEAALERAQNRTLTAFLKQASKGILIKKLPLQMQASFPAGRYVKSPDNEPASYVINPSRPNERRLMAEVIAFHEGIPGHHLWAAYPRETPADTYKSGVHGLLEGWAIYSEYVADEMGLFSSKFDRQGMIAKHLWAASRLIVEPGLHLRGWSREKAITFMLDNTVLSRTEIEIEVDRYIAMPGQSLTYILGSDLIMSERERARKIMGNAFDIREFHDVVLRAGSRPLPKVRDDIRAWVGSANKISQVIRTE
jgi:uncharacterized protein (DUF885 family)